MIRVRDKLGRLCSVINVDKDNTKGTNNCEKANEWEHKDLIEEVKLREDMSENKKDLLRQMNCLKRKILSTGEDDLRHHTCQV